LWSISRALVYLPISNVLMNRPRPEDNARWLQNSVLVATWHKISVIKERQKVVRRISFSSRMPRILGRATCDKWRSRTVGSVRYMYLAVPRNKGGRRGTWNKDVASKQRIWHISECCLSISYFWDCSILQMKAEMGMNVKLRRSWSLLNKISLRYSNRSHW
jgi:hypothetical protein